MIKYKKILLNGTSLVRQGLFPHLLTKFKYYQKHGFKFYIYTGNQIYSLNKISNIYNFNQKQKYYLTMHDGKISKIYFIFYALLSNIKGILNFKLLLKHNFEIIYSTSSVLNLCIVPYFLKSIKTNIKWITIFDNTVPLIDPGNPFIRVLAWIFYKFSLILLKKSDLIFVISNDLKSYLINNGFEEKKIVITGNAIEREALKQAKKPLKYLYDSIYIGRINETKGIFDLLEVLNIVVKNYPNFKLAIMGVGDTVTTIKFKKAITNLKLNNNVVFLGYITGVKKYQTIKSAKICIFLSKSKSESFGIALLEAVVCGLPALTYDLAPYKEIYKNQEIFSFPIGSTKLVANKIIDIFNKKQFINRRGKKLIKKYSWENIAKLELLNIKNKL